MLNIDVDEFFGRNDDKQARNDFLDKLVEIDKEIYCHYIDGDSIQFCDDRSSPVLVVTQNGVEAEEGYVNWDFYFVEDDENYSYQEKVFNILKEIDESEQF